MLTGGAPTMHPALVNELTHFANERNIFTTIETEGSHFLATDHPIGLVSISPKFANSVPVLGAVTPQGKVADQKMIDQHNKFRLNYSAIAQMIAYHSNFHLKPVIDKNLTIIPEYEEFLDTLAAELQNVTLENGFDYTMFEVEELRYMLKYNTWMMPAGDDRPALFESYPVVMNYCRDNGYKFTGREHIMAFGTERCV
jgi:7-carboxy-7-deazaguanine synthase